MQETAEAVAPEIPSAFIWRRLHSITGVWLVLFLIEHLLTNSQAALFFGDYGAGFINGVNSIKNLPYLPVIEIVFLAIPFAIHLGWGIKILLTSKSNAYAASGARPYLAYGRNKAYTWQRITSWILLIGIIVHVVHMRFLEYPASAYKGPQAYYFVRLSSDPGLYTLSERLDFTLYDEQKIKVVKEELLNPPPKSYTARETLKNFFSSMADLFLLSKEDLEKERQAKQALKDQEREMDKKWIVALEKKPVNRHQVIAVAKTFGTAELLVVRDAFKNPVNIVLYTLLVLATCYHAFNGLWTAMITWGITLTQRSQKLMLKFSYFLMTLIAFLGLAAIWGTYWINLKQ